MSIDNSATDFAIATDPELCAQLGHASHYRAGILQPECLRCGAPIVLGTEAAKPAHRKLGQAYNTFSGRVGRHAQTEQEIREAYAGGLTYEA